MSRDSACDNVDHIFRRFIKTFSRLFWAESEHTVLKVEVLEAGKGHERSKLNDACWEWRLACVVWANRDAVLKLQKKVNTESDEKVSEQPEHGGLLCERLHIQHLWAQLDNQVYSLGLKECGDHNTTSEVQWSPCHTGLFLIRAD